LPLQVYMGSGSALVLARATDSGRHAHRAAQLVLALETPFRMEAADAAEQEVSWAALAPQIAHRVRGENQRIAHLFVDSGPRAWHRWRSEGHQAVPPSADLVEALRQAGRRGLDRHEAERLARRWRDQSLPGLRVTGPEHPRIARAVARIEADPADPVLSHRVLAAEVHLSPSRFVALFREHTGMAVRNYVLWRRLLCAMEYIEAGHRVTEAAHHAGFADAAHLSRSFRKIMGAAPSELRLPAAP